MSRKRRILAYRHVYGLVLAGHGLVISEVALRTLCDCTVFGTEALNAVDAVRRLGFAQTMKATLSMAELADQSRRGSYPIVFINTLPLDGIQGGHAVVVLDIQQAEVTVYDPFHGERVLSRDLFTTAWAMMHNLVILVQR
jgi:ABC-type bacteriocin/lantibiotic exporter with double-glycine peptidase domain